MLHLIKELVHTNIASNEVVNEATKEEADTDENAKASSAVDKKEEVDEKDAENIDKEQQTGVSKS